LLAGSCSDRRVVRWCSGVSGDEVRRSGGAALGTLSEKTYVTKMRFNS
jgi:hypothetical protein